MRFTPSRSAAERYRPVGLQSQRLISPNLAKSGQRRTKEIKEKRLGLPCQVLFFLTQFQSAKLANSKLCRSVSQRCRNTCSQSLPAPLSIRRRASIMVRENANAGSRASSSRNVCNSRRVLRRRGRRPDDAILHLPPATALAIEHAMVKGVRELASSARLRTSVVVAELAPAPT